MRKILTAIDTMNEAIGRAVSWLTFALVLVVCADVFGRYLLSRTSPWVMELEWHLFALIFLLGAGYTLKRDEHVRVDLFYEKFRIKDKAQVNLVGGLLFLLPWSALITYYGFQFAHHSWQLGEGSENPGGLNMRYLIKAAIPVGFLLLFLQGLAEVIRSFIVMRDLRKSKADS